MTKALQLRCQFGSGQKKPLVGLTEVSNLTELQAVIFSITEIQPQKQRIKCGYPPKLLDTSNDDKPLKECGIRSGDTLIVEEGKGDCGGTATSSANSQQQSSSSPNKVAVKMSKMVRNFVVLNDTSFAGDLRILAANCIAGDPETYNEVFLGKPNWEYCEWLTKKDHWGGAIELNVFSQHYQMEINAVDVQSGRIDRFGEGNHYPNRVFVIYDGIHYDPMGLEENNTIIQTVFPTSNARFQVEAMEVAGELKKKRQFTDLSGFSLRCMVCSTPLKGQTQAQQHAKETGHTNFGEV